MILILFLSFGWLGSTKVKNEHINLETFMSYIQSLSSGAGFETKPMTLDQFFTQLGFHYFIPTTSEFKSESEQLKNDISNYCESLKAEPDTSKTSDLHVLAQQSWTKTMLTYHKILAAPFGPIYDNSRDMANNIYSWPLMYECGMHVQMLEIKNNGQFDSKALYTSQGLMAVEFSLFNDLTTTTCGKSRRFTKVHEWVATTDLVAKKKDMCNLALKSAELVVKKANELHHAWSVDGNNFTFQWVGGSAFENFKTSFNTLTDAMFYFEVAKDVQLGKPLGLHKDCLSTDKKCPEDIEHKWSQIGLDAIEMQFVGLNQIFNEGGFGQYLMSIGFEDTYLHITALNDSILKTIDSLKSTGTLNYHVENLNVSNCQNTTIEHVLEPICGLQQQIRQMNILFKSELLPALSLNAPKAFQGDND